MLNIPVEIKEKLKTNTAPKNFRVTFPNGERADIINDNIVFESVRFTESVMSQDKFKLGLCESPVIEFEAFDIENIKGKKIECYYEIYCEDTVDDAVYREDLDAYVYPIPLGIFYVDSCKKEAKMNMRRVIAYGMQAYFEWKIPEEAYYIPNIYQRFQNLDLSTYLLLVLQTEEVITVGQTHSYYSSNLSYYEQDNRMEVFYVGGSYTYGRTQNEYTELQTSDAYDVVNVKYGSTPFTPPSPGATSPVSVWKARFYRTYKTSINENVSSIVSGQEVCAKYSGITQNANSEYQNAQMTSHMANFFASHEYYRIDGNNERITGLNESLFIFSPVANIRLPYNLVTANGSAVVDMRTQLEVDYFLQPSPNGSLVAWNDTLSDYKIIINGTTTTNVSLVDTINQLYVLSDYSIVCESLIDMLEYLTGGTYDATRGKCLIFDSGWLNGDSRPQITKAFECVATGIKIINEATPRDEIQKHAEDVLESRGKLGRFDRDGNFELFTIDTDTLVPNNTDLVPSESLVPNGADVDTIYPSEYETAWYDDELSLPYGACSATHKVSGTDTYTIVYADGYNANTDPSTYQIYDISNNDLIKEMTVEEITPILTTIITNLSNLRYMPSDIDMVGRPDIEAGDGIQVMSNSGAFNTYVLSRTIDGIQGLSDTITAK